MDISRKEILRYLGYRGKPADEIVTNSIESCLAELLRVISPKCIYQIFPVTFGENHIVTIGSISIQSKNLSQHINGCKEAAIFAATLGAQTDLLIQKYNKLDMSKAVILQACAATVIEAYCDEQQDFMKEEAGKQGLLFTSSFQSRLWRFSAYLSKRLTGCLKLPKAHRSYCHGQSYFGAK